MWWLLAFAYTVGGIGLFLYILILFLRSCVFRLSDPSKCSIGFFHPNCSAGGGGERVLWCAIASIAKGLISRGGLEHVRIVIYSGVDGLSPSEVLEKVQRTFGINLDPRLEVKFVYVRNRHLLTPERWPRLTMLGQGLGSAAVAWEALRQYVPDIWIDTTGCPFTYPVAKLFASCAVGAYVHYPTITSDMLERVHDRRPTYNNAASVASSPSLSFLKSLYYRAYAFLYAGVGGFTDSVMANSSWTVNHLTGLWRLPPHLSAAAIAAASAATGDGEEEDGGLADSYRPNRGIISTCCRACSCPSFFSFLLCCSPTAMLRRPRACVVFPPCNGAPPTPPPTSTPRRKGKESSTATSSEASSSSSSSSARKLKVAQETPVKERTIISINQFRPEKEHSLQLQAFAEFRKRNSSYQDIRLLLVGGCRDDGDKERVAALQKLASEIGITSVVDFHINLPFPQLQEMLSKASAGIHTMWNEHFGISVVEIMAAGAIMIAHDSGGPRSDIIVPFRGGGSTEKAAGNTASVAAPSAPQPTGFLATTCTEYADALEAVFSPANSKAMQDIREEAKKSVSRFSDAVFDTAYFACIRHMVKDALDTADKRR